MATAVNEMIVSRFGTEVVGTVGVSQIETALAQAWQDASSPQNGSTPPIRRSVLTLLAVAADRDDIERITTAIAQLPSYHPSRAIIILSEPADEPALQAWVSVEVAPTSAGDTLAGGSEQIILSAHGTAVARLPSLVDAFLLTDLPTVLWWRTDLGSGQQRLFRRLVDVADRLIVDSLTQGLAMHQAMLHLVRRHDPCAPSDLNWTRLEPWRELVAQFFDSPNLQPFLDRLDTVMIEYGTTEAPPNPAAAILFAGWLASRLGWTFDRRLGGDDPNAGTMHFLLNGRAGPVAVDLRGRADGPVAGVLERVELKAGVEATFQVERMAGDVDHAATAVALDNGSPLRRIVRMTDPVLSQLLGSEFGFFGRDHAYEDALSVAALLLDRR